MKWFLIGMAFSSIINPIINAILVKAGKRSDAQRPQTSGRRIGGKNNAQEEKKE